MTTEDFGPDAEQWVAVIPTAAVEQHGPHLPLGTDAMIAEGMVETVVQRLPESCPATFLPVLPVGKSNEHAAFNGTLTLGWESAIRSFVEIGASVARTGVRRIVFVNAHGGNTALLDVVTMEMRARFDVLCVHSAWLRFGDGGTVDPDERTIGIHGGLIETSLMLNFRPGLVRKELAATFNSRQTELTAEHAFLCAHGPHAFAWQAQDLNPAGAVGNAAAASAELGAAIARHQADCFITLLQEVARTPLSILR